MATYFNTREEWLGVAAEEIAPYFEAHGFKLPAKLRFACSWPANSRGGKKVLGQCVAPEASQDGHTEIYIVPTVAEPKLALGILVHELVHAAVGVRHKHNRTFAAACAKLGLTGKATEALPGPELAAMLEAKLEVLGAYPHGAVNIDTSKKQATRMLKAVCPETGYSVRLTKKQVAVGMPTSPDGVKSALKTLAAAYKLTTESVDEEMRRHLAAAMRVLVAHTMELETDDEEGEGE